MGGKMLRRVILSAVVCAVALVSLQQAIADVYVRGYYRSNGTYVQPHYRSNPDGNPYNNWSTYPNVNPYTGTMGTKHIQLQTVIINPYVGSFQTKQIQSYLPSGINYRRSYQTPDYSDTYTPTYYLGW
jgi:hypothetical protein